jgi:prepilin peptidase CpaA
VLVDLALLVAVGTSAVTDLLRGKIYNVVTYPAVVLGLLGNCLLPDGVGLQACLIGLAVGFIPFFALFALGLMNGGDVKLLAAVGALKGYPFILDVVVLSFVVAAFLALAKLIWLGRTLRTLRELGWSLISVLLPGMALKPPPVSETIPFGVAVMVGSIWALAIVAWRSPLGPAW